MSMPQRRSREIPCIAALLAAAAAAPAVASRDGGTLFRTSLRETASARLDHALDQFAQPAAWIELAIGIALAALLSLAIAFHPRGVRRRGGVEPVAAIGGRRSLVSIGLTGAVLAALVLVDQAMVFIVLGALFVGGLLVFRSASANPHLVGRAVLVAAIGLACGLSQYLLAVVVTVAAWAAIWWMEARRGGEIKVRIPAGADLRRAELVATLELRMLGCRVRALRIGRSGRALTITFSMPSALDETALCRALEARLGVEVGYSEVEIKSSG
jgi:hypothetical protein